MKRIVTCILSVILLLALFPGLSASAAGRSASGTHGDNLFWEYDDSTRTLTISGSGEMPCDYEENIYGWYYLRDVIRHLVIEEGITRISDRAFFKEFRHLKTVSFPASLQSIGSWAFSGCTSLTAIDLPDTLKVIGDSAFSDCSALKTVRFPASLQSIGASAFSGCTSLTDFSFLSLPEEFGDYIFYGCTSLTSVSLPQGMTELPKGMFDGCTGLTAVDLPDTLKVIGDSAFRGCTALESIQLPEALESIQASAFRDCTSLETVEFPDSLNTIEAYAFGGCAALSPVKLSARTQVNWDAFDGCPDQSHLFRNVFLYNSWLYLIYAAVALIGLIGLALSLANWWRSGHRIPWKKLLAAALLIAVVIVTGLGLGLYQQYKGRYIPRQSDCNYEFDAATKTLTISGSGWVYEPRTYNYGEGLSIEHIVIEEGFTGIGSYAFYGFPDLKTISLPHSLRKVEDYAFEGCGQPTYIDIPWHTYVHPVAFDSSPWPPSLWFHMFLQYLPLILLVLAPVLILIVPSIQVWWERKKRSQ